LEKIAALGSVADGDVVFFVCDEPPAVNRMSGDIRLKLGRDLDIVEKNVYRFCWVVDFPMYEFDPQEQRIVFSHNPFSMPQGGLEALETKNPLEILAWQYDIVCNGIELSSGAIRNHSPEVMIKAFEIAGYSRDDVEEKFSFLLNAFRLGAPPHGGIAPGVDRIVMLLAHETNIREVIAFPMNQRAQDLMMGSPSSVSERQLRELHIRLNLPRDRGVDNLVAPHV
jgi:aspartyl-tRNA synthetase